MKKAAKYFAALIATFAFIVWAAIGTGGPIISPYPYNPAAVTITGGNFNGITAGNLTNLSATNATLTGISSSNALITGGTASNYYLIPPTVTLAANGTLSVGQISGTFLNNWGMGSTTNVVATLPAATVNKAYSFTFAASNGSTSYYRFTPTATSNIYLDGTAANGYVQINPVTVGAGLSCFTFTTASNKADYYCLTVSGAWTPAP